MQGSMQDLTVSIRLCNANDSETARTWKLAGRKHDPRGSL